MKCRRRAIGSVTYYPAMDAFRDWMEGSGTLESFRKAGPPVVELVYDESCSCGTCASGVTEAFTEK